jgi:hypothetical protein
VTIEDDIGFSSVCPHRVYFFLWLAKLVPNAKRITNPNSGHEIHKEQPQLVIHGGPHVGPHGGHGGNSTGGLQGAMDCVDNA